MMEIIKDLKTGKAYFNFYGKKTEIVDVGDFVTQHVDSQKPSLGYIARVTLAEAITDVILHPGTAVDLPAGGASVGAKILMEGFEAIDQLENYIRTQQPTTKRSRGNTAL